MIVHDLAIRKIPHFKIFMKRAAPFDAELAQKRLDLRLLVAGMIRSLRPPGSVGALWRHVWK